MNPDAKVKLLGVQVGKVESIEQQADGQAALHLSIDSSQLGLIPDNVLVDIASSTVFGAKFVQLVLPRDPSAATIRPGQVLAAERVTVEINTIFERLTSVLLQIEPVKLNEALGAISRAISGRGKRIGQSLKNLDSFLAKLDPAMPALSHDLAAVPGVLNTYADTAPDLLRTATNATNLSTTLVDRQRDLDALLVSAIGLGDIGNQFLVTNGPPLQDVMRLLVPTSSLLDEYAPALNCGLLGMLDLANVTEAFPTSASGIQVSVNFALGHDRYRYPSDLPKVAASGGPQCEVLPVRYQEKPPYVVTDTGVNPFKRGNQGWVLNSDGLKQLLFGPLDGPPRNSAQVGQPG
jgi:virulence factor Mce-like protein